MALASDGAWGEVNTVVWEVYATDGLPQKLNFFDPSDRWYMRFLNPFLVRGCGLKQGEIGGSVHSPDKGESPTSGVLGRLEICGVAMFSDANKHVHLPTCSYPKPPTVVPTIFLFCP